MQGFHASCTTRDQTGHIVAVKIFFVYFSIIIYYKYLKKNTSMFYMIKSI